MTLGKSFYSIFYSFKFNVRFASRAPFCILYIMRFPLFPHTFSQAWDWAMCNDIGGLKSGGWYNRPCFFNSHPPLHSTPTTQISLFNTQRPTLVIPHPTSNSLLSSSNTLHGAFHSTPNTNYISHPTPYSLYATNNTQIPLFYTQLPTLFIPT